MASGYRVLPDPLPSSGVFYPNDFERGGHLALDPSHIMAHHTISTKSNKEPAEQIQIEQEPDSTEAFKHLPTRSASPEHPLKEDGEESKTGKDGLCCLHCKEIIDGYAHRGFYTNCAYRVQKRCPNCRQMVGDIDRHMKRHPETASLRCTVQGCDSTRVFTKEGLLRHRQRAHPAIFSREGIIRRRQQRGLAEYFAKHDSLSLSEADSPVMECEMDQMTRMMCNLRCSDECEV